MSAPPEVNLHVPQNRDEMVQAEIASLAAMKPEQYELLRIGRAERIGFRVQKLDRFVSRHRRYLASQKPPAVTCSDMGNAERFVAEHGEKVLYCAADRAWRVWDGLRWRLDRLGEAGDLAQKTARNITAFAQTLEDFVQREQAMTWGLRSENAPQIANMLKLAGMNPEVAALPEEFDADPWLLTVGNGTLDLRDGTLREPKQEDMVSRMTAARFEQGAKCPAWERHLETVQPDPAMRAFLQRCAGYSLTGLDSEEVFFFLQGDGQTGKSKTLGTALILRCSFSRPRHPSYDICLKGVDGGLNLLCPIAIRGDVAKFCL